MIEILAPAGNTECASVAIDCGADAIYLGFKAFSARNSAENFGIDELQSLVKKARFHGVYYTKMRIGGQSRTREAPLLSAGQGGCAIHDNENSPTATTKIRQLPQRKFANCHNVIDV